MLLRLRASVLSQCSRRLAGAAPRCLEKNIVESIPILKNIQRPISTHCVFQFSVRHFSTSPLDHQNNNHDNNNNNADDESYTIHHRSGVRCVAIVAHVDHGKTTLVDKLLQVAQGSRDAASAAAVAAAGAAGMGELVMDSGELERERGITITSKVTRLDYFPLPSSLLNNNNNSNNDYNMLTINVVDTPGHADFAGEVDRILSMVDGVCLVVDAAEGPMAQTKYVLARALSMGLKPLVILNKVDRDDALSRIETGETESKVLDLFDALGATDDQMDYTTLYASARQGWATPDANVATMLAKGGYTGAPEHSMRVLLDCIIDQIPEPTVRCYDPSLTEDDDDEGGSYPGSTFALDKFSLAAVTVGNDQYLGRTCTGRIYSGSISMSDPLLLLKRMDPDADVATSSSSTAATGASASSVLAGLFINRGTSRTPLETPVAYAGDIVTLAGVPDTIAVGDTITCARNPVTRPIETPPLSPPTLSMDFGSNSGPMAGKEGTQVTSAKIRVRLTNETDNNVTLTVIKSATDTEKTTVYARGELQLGILIEQMRREGFELLISPPRILTKECPTTGALLEPFEEVTVDVDPEYSGAVVSALTSDRKGVLMQMNENSADGKTRLIFDVPSRGLLGFATEIATATRGSAVVNHCYLEDREYVGALGTGLEKGKLVSNESGKASAYALQSLLARGTLFVEPGDVVYPGMIIGENSKSGDMEVNPVRAKTVSNIRTTSKDEKMYLPPPKRMSVEELIGYMNEDEMIEVTPNSIRLRKAELDAGLRARTSKSKKQSLQAAAAERKSPR